MRTYQNTLFVDSITEVELRPRRGAKRIYLAVQNASSNSVDMNTDTHADSNNGQEIQAMQTYEQDRGVTNAALWFKGRAAAGTLQMFKVTEGYPD